VYRAVQYQGRQLVDGGLLNNLPVEALLGRPGERIVGLHCNPLNTDVRVYTLRRLIERTLQLALSTNIVGSKAQCDLLLEPPALRDYRPLDYRKAPELFEVGYRYTFSRAADLQALVAAS